MKFICLKLLKKKFRLSDNKKKVILLTQVDLSIGEVNLPEPTDNSCGHHRIISTDNKIIYHYSPIDLAIATIHSFLKNVEITNLKRFFRETPSPREAESYVYIGILDNGAIQSHPVSYWQMLIKNDDDLRKLLSNQAPFTFREWVV